MQCNDECNFTGANAEFDFNFATNFGSGIGSNFDPDSVSNFGFDVGSDASADAAVSNLLDA